MGGASDTSGKLDDSGMLALIGKIMLVAIILLFVVVVVIFFFHLYAKWFWGRRPEDNGDSNSGTRRRRRSQRRRTELAEVQAAYALRRGLDPSVLKTIPVVPFNSEDFKDGLECSVCLCDVSEGEKARFLLKCNHGFHVDCIDMWFQAHSTCPICRDPISKLSSPNSTSEESETELDSPPVEEVSASTDPPNFPTNVLYWGDDTQVSSLAPSSSNSPSTEPSTSNSPDGMLVIDIPKQTTQGDEEQRSPIPTMFRSLKRLLSRDWRANPSSPRSDDIEQGSSSQS